MSPATFLCVCVECTVAKPILCSEQNQFVSHMHGMLSDANVRVRTEAINAVGDHIAMPLLRHPQQKPIADTDIIMEFIGNVMVQDVPYQFQAANQPMKFTLEPGERHAVERALGKCLFDLTNLLFELESCEQLVNE